MGSSNRRNALDDTLRIRHPLRIPACAYSENCWPPACFSSLLSPPPLLAAQTPPPVAAQSGMNDSLASRQKTLNAIFSDIWEDQLKHSPEFASSIGDRRYADQLSDYSVAAYNDSLARGRAFLVRLSQVDTTGMSDQEGLSKELMVRQLIEDQEEARFKPWEMPVNQFYGLQTDLPELVTEIPFDSRKDYDDYIERLKKVPVAFEQITDNISIGMEDHRVPPRYLLEKVLVQVNAISGAKPEESPFALPLKKFPASIPALDQARIKKDLLAAITQSVMPAYTRFGKFLQAQYIPAGRAEPGIWALSDGDAYYAFLVKQSTTTDQTPAQIHQLGLDQVKQDEEQLLAIAHKLGFADIQALENAVKNNPKLRPTSADQLLRSFSRRPRANEAKASATFRPPPKGAARGQRPSPPTWRRIRQPPITTTARQTVRARERYM